MDQDLNVRIAQRLVLVAKKIAYLLLAHMMLRQGDVLSPNEAATCSFVDIPRHVCSRQNEDATCISFLLILCGRFSAGGRALKVRPLDQEFSLRPA
jgi:hypothetical protein